jgi:hypothetical protein
METSILVKKQIIQAIEHNIAQFQMQIKKEGDASKRAAMEELLARERVKHKNISRPIKRFEIPDPQAPSPYQTFPRASTLHLPPSRA